MFPSSNSKGKEMESDETQHRWPPEHVAEIKVEVTYNGKIYSKHAWAYAEKGLYFPIAEAIDNAGSHVAREIICSLPN
jgi:hypothetical protein